MVGLALIPVVTGQEAGCGVDRPPVYIKTLPTTTTSRLFHKLP